jgi:alanyl-tRNA synthetase
MTELLITYPAGSTAETSTVVAATRADRQLLFAVERTPCHPESPRWPDQPADRCTVSTPGRGEAVAVAVECLEGFLREGELGVGEPLDGDGAAQAIPCVVHRAPAALAIDVGVEVRLSVDERYRRLVSASHSRCHLVSLALNAALAAAWRKEPPARDSLGNPDFDKLAIVSSRIDEAGSVDVYRIGKHVRKKGFSADALSDPEALAQEVGRIADGWLRSNPEIVVTPGRCRLEERRTWSCALSEGIASFPCGGTHVTHMEPEDRPVVSIAWDPEERRLAMTASAAGDLTSATGDLTNAAVSVRQSVYD